MAHKIEGFVKLWQGDYSHRALERNELRGNLLLAIERHAPGVLERLRDDCLPVYQRFRSSEFQGMPPDWKAVCDAADRHPEARELVDALEAWTKSFHLGQADFVNITDDFEGDPWVLNQGMATLYYWLMSLKQGKKPLLKWIVLPAHAYHEPLGEGEDTIHIDFWDWWRFDTEPRKAVKERAMKVFEGFLEDELQRIEYIARQRNWQPTSKLKSELDAHLEWLIRRHVQEWTWRQVADVYAPATYKNRISTVLGGVTTAAELLGLRLRTGKRGRPRKR